VSEARKLAAILVADIVGYSRLAGADEDRILARLRTPRSDLIDPTIAVHHGRVVKRTGDGAIVEFRSVVDAVRCAIEVQSGLAERNAGVPPEKRIEYRVGRHLGDIVEESDGDLMGDGVKIAARLEGVAKPGAICLSEDAYRQVKQRLDLKVSDLGATLLKNIAEPIRVYSLEVGQPAEAKPTPVVSGMPSPPRLSLVVLPFANIGGDPEQEHFVDGVTESLTTDLSRIRGAGHDAEAREALQLYLALPSTQSSRRSRHGRRTTTPSPPTRAPIHASSRRTSGCTTACARPGCRRDERDPQTCRDLCR
jgi:adenylate cyclase